MNKRKKIKKLKKEIRIVYSHNKRFLDKLVAVELALNPDSQICDITSPSTAKRVAELVAENKRLKSASVPTDVKCGKCHGLGWLFWDELANYNRRNYDRIGSARKRLAEYLETGNLELLSDAANLCMLEFEHGTHPLKHWGPVDDGEHVQLTDENNA